MHRFFCPIIDNNTATLSGEEAHHAEKVLRLTAGQSIEIFNGKGISAVATIAQINKKEISLVFNSVKKSWDFELNLPSVAIAVPKNIARFEWFIEKATEIGVQSIFPLVCERSERNKLRIDRCEKIILAATKQSNRSVLPKIHEIQNFQDFLKDSVQFEQKLIAYCTPNSKLATNQIKTTKNTLFCIGPEGDFSEKEIELSIQYKFKPLSLGEFRLRTETAGIFVCSAFQHQSL